MNETYFTADEVAAKIGVHTRTVRRYINSGILKGSKIAGRWLVRKEDLTNFINSDKTFDSDDIQSVKEDDLCVFMDSEYYKSNSKLQICSIIDYETEDKVLANGIASSIMEAINCSFDNCHDNTKFQYVYKDKENKARFVVWANPSALTRVMEAIQHAIPSK